MPTTLEQLQYGFDRDSRRTWRQRATTQGWDNTYAYDSLSQVIGDDRGDLNLAHNAIAGIPANGARWQYDETGNWHGYQTLADGAATLNQARTHDKGNRLMEVSEAAAMRTDRAGRMLETVPGPDGDWGKGYEITWDAWSRITAVASVEGETITPVAAYAYDGLTRRITRYTDSEDVTLHSYYNDVWRPVEDRKDSETTATLSYLWGSRHRDDLVRRDRAVGGTTLNETRYVLMDYFSPAAITDEAGEVTERYQFSAFGLRTILNPDFTVRSTSECGMDFSFQGQFEDVETGWLNYGFRYYLPALGRWACKDPISEDGGHNLYAMVANDSVNQSDYLGQVGGGGIGGPQWVPPGGFKPPQPGENRFPKLIEAARRQYRKDIDSWVDANCGKTPFSGPSRRFAVYANEEGAQPKPISDQVDPNFPVSPVNDSQFGDQAQGHWESTTYGLGSFVIDIETPVTITYGPGYGSSQDFKWSAVMYLEDNTGDVLWFGETQKNSQNGIFPVRDHAVSRSNC